MSYTGNEMGSAPQTPTPNNERAIEWAARIGAVVFIYWFFKLIHYISQTL